MQCILCLNPFETILHIFSNDGKHLQIEEIIKKYFGLIPSENADSSKAICYSCWGHVQIFHDFYKTIEAVHKTGLSVRCEVPNIVYNYEHSLNESIEETFHENANIMDDDDGDPLEVTTKKTKFAESEDDNDDCPEKRKTIGKRKDYRKVRVFQSPDDAMKYVKFEKIWSKKDCNTTKLGTKHFYRCNVVKRYSAVKCPAGMYLLYSKYDETVTLYITSAQHNHENCRLSLRPMSENIKEEVIRMLDINIKCKDIFKELQKLNYVDIPTENQLRSFIRSLNTNKRVPDPISVRDLRHFLEENQMIPIDENEPFISNYDVEQNMNSANFRFFVTTKKLMGNTLQLKSHICTDSFNKLTWQGFPILFVGSTDMENKFHCFGLCIASSEYEHDFQFLFQSVQSAMQQIYYCSYNTSLLVSNSNVIYSAFQQVFGGHLLYCFESVAKTISKKLDQLKVDKTDKKSIIEDLRILQQSTSENIFHVGVKLFCSKYKNVTDFISYFKYEWVIRKFSWYEGYEKRVDRIPSSNSALYTFAGDVRRRSIIRERLCLEEFQTALFQCVRSLSEETCYRELSVEPYITKSIWLDGQSVAASSTDITHCPKEDNAFYTVYKFDLAEWTCLTNSKNFSDFGRTIQQNIIVHISRYNWKIGKCICEKFYKEFVCKHIISVAIRYGKVDASFFYNNKLKTASITN